MSDKPTFDMLVEDIRAALERRNRVGDGLRFDAVGLRLGPGLHRFAYYKNEVEAGCIEIFDNHSGLIGYMAFSIDAQLTEIAWVPDILGADGIVSRQN